MELINSIKNKSCFILKRLNIALQYLKDKNQKTNVFSEFNFSKDIYWRKQLRQYENDN